MPRARRSPRGRSPRGRARSLCLWQLLVLVEVPRWAKRNTSAQGAAALSDAVRALGEAGSASAAAAAAQVMRSMTAEMIKGELLRALSIRASSAGTSSAGPTVGSTGLVPPASSDGGNTAHADGSPPAARCIRDTHHCGGDGGDGVGRGEPSPPDGSLGAEGSSDVRDNGTSAATTEKAELGIARVSLDELVFLRRIGGGGAGMAYAASWAGKTVAVKVAHATDLDSWRREVAALAKLRHPNIVSCLGVLAEPPTYGLVLEFCAGSDLSAAVRSPTPRGFALHAARSVAAGMAYLHGQRVMHRDLKGGNVLLGEGGAIKLTDFGLAAPAPDDTVVGGMLTAETGTYRYMAPEVIRHERYSKSAECERMRTALGPRPTPPRNRSLVSRVNVSLCGAGAVYSLSVGCSSSCSRARRPSSIDHRCRPSSPSRWRISGRRCPRARLRWWLGFCTHAGPGTAAITRGMHLPTLGH